MMLLWSFAALGNAGVAGAATRTETARYVGARAAGVPAQFPTCASIPNVPAPSVGGACFTAAAGDLTIAVALEDDAGLTVPGRIVFASKTVEFCGSIDGVALPPGTTTFAVGVDQYRTGCATVGKHGATSGTVTVRFLDSPPPSPPPPTPTPIGTPLPTPECSLPPAAANAPRFREPVFAGPGNEPVIAVSPKDGSVYVQAYTPLYKSTDGGLTFHAVPLPTSIMAVSNDGDIKNGDLNMDGFLAITRSGRVLFSTAMDGAVELWYSDDGAATWTHSPIVQPLSHRMWIWTGTSPTIHMGIDALPNGEAVYWRSEDDGTTWIGPTRVPNGPSYGASPVPMLLQMSTAGQSPIVANSAGVVTWPTYTYTAPGSPVGAWFALTSDDGVAFAPYPISQQRGARATIVTGATVDTAGRFYFAWSEWTSSGSTVYLTHSQDAKTWSAPVVVSQGSGMRVMPMIASPAPGVLGFVWYQTDCVVGVPGDLDAPWHVQFARMTGADTTTPTVVESRASDRVIHYGGVSVEGPVSTGDRRLADFPWITFDSAGRALLAVTATTGFDGKKGAVVLVEDAPPGGASAP
jgi:hypothetical protein